MKKKVACTLPEAAFGDDTKRVMGMVNSGSPVDQRDEIGNTALVIAAGRGNEDLVKALLKAGANVNATTSKTVSSARGGTALIYAVRAGYKSIAKRLVDAGAKVNAETTWGESPLYEATCQGDLKTVEYLIKQDAKPTLIVPFIAIQNRKLQILKAVLSAGANPNWRNPKTEDTLLGKALQFTKDPAFVSLLLKSGADPNILTGRRGPLNLAARFMGLKTCKLLVAHGAQVNRQDNFKRTPLMDAASRGREEIVKFLLVQSADIRKRDKEGKTAWDLAKEGGHLNLLPLLEVQN